MVMSTRLAVRPFCSRCCYHWGPHHFPMQKKTAMKISFPLRLLKSYPMMTMTCCSNQRPRRQPPFAPRVAVVAVLFLGGQRPISKRSFWNRFRHYSGRGDDGGDDWWHPSFWWWLGAIAMKTIFALLLVLSLRWSEQRLQPRLSRLLLPLLPPSTAPAGAAAPRPACRLCATACIRRPTRACYARGTDRP